MPKIPASTPALRLRSCRYSIRSGENWFAPQPTANIDSATRRQLPGDRILPGTMTAAMLPT
jgi:hypothetical protein